MAKVRSRYWRPPTRAPNGVASGDVGQVSERRDQILWFASDGMATAQDLAKVVCDVVLPWFDLFHDPDRLRHLLYTGDVPLIDPATALEILLATFDPYEARVFLSDRIGPRFIQGPLSEQRGFNLDPGRVDVLAFYYRLL